MVMTPKPRHRRLFVGNQRQPTRAELDNSVWIQARTISSCLQRLNFQNSFSEKVCVKWEDLSFDVWTWPAETLKEQFDRSSLVTFLKPGTAAGRRLWTRSFAPSELAEPRRRSTMR